MAGVAAANTAPDERACFPEAMSIDNYVPPNVVQNKLTDGVSAAACIIEAASLCLCASYTETGFALLPKRLLVPVVLPDVPSRSCRAASPQSFYWHGRNVGPAFSLAKDLLSDARNEVKSTVDPGGLVGNRLTDVLEHAVCTDSCAFLGPLVRGRVRLPESPGRWAHGLGPRLGYVGLDFDEGNPFVAEADLLKGAPNRFPNVGVRSLGVRAPFRAPGDPFDNELTIDVDLDWGHASAKHRINGVKLGPGDSPLHWQVSW